MRHYPISSILPTPYYTNKNNYYLITSLAYIDVPGYNKISTIDSVEIQNIKDSHFFLVFECDDEYIYHLDKIIKNNGTFSVHGDSDKTNYLHSNIDCYKALCSTVEQINEISHYNEIIHGNICQAIQQTAKLEGDYVEIGVYKGGSALTALNYLRISNIKRKVFLLDTFNGFHYQEAENSCDLLWKNTHELFGINETQNYLLQMLNKYNSCQDFKLVENNIITDELPSEITKIAVANIDVDMLEATTSAFNKVAEKIVLGGIIIAEDPASCPGLIGSFYAMEQFLQSEIGGNFMKLHLTGQYFLIKIK